MRGGWSRWRARPVETVDPGAGAPGTAAGEPAPPAPPGEHFGAQLPLEGLEAPAEILVSISPDALAGEPELGEIASDTDEAAELDATSEAGDSLEVVAEPEAVRALEPTEPDLRVEGPVEVEVAATEAADEEMTVGLAVESPARETSASDLDAGPPLSEPAGTVPVDYGKLQIRMARVHLRTGSLAMARAELETLAGRRQLNAGALLDLAEVRWRTGDLAGAGEAAASYLDDGGDAPLGFLIAAEAAALAGRIDEAHIYAEEALERHMVDLDLVFAGMPRKARWSLPGSDRVVGLDAEPAAPAELAAAPEPAAAPEEPAAAPEPAAPAAERAAAMPQPESDQLLADSEVASARSCLEANDPLMAALHFGVAIRIAPASARTILEAIGDREDLPLQLVRGDALRILGLEVDAGRAYRSVASALGSPEAPPARRD